MYVKATTNTYQNNHQVTSQCNLGNKRYRATKHHYVGGYYGGSDADSIKQDFQWAQWKMAYKSCEHLGTKSGNHRGCDRASIGPSFFKRRHRENLWSLFWRFTFGVYRRCAKYGKQDGVCKSMFLLISKDCKCQKLRRNIKIHGELVIFNFYFTCQKIEKSSFLWFWA